MVYIAQDDGTFVDSEHQYIAELVKEYDHSLSLVYIPETRREPGDKPYAVVATQADGQPYVALYADVCDQRILERLYRADNNKRNVMSEVEAANVAARALKKKRERDEAELRMEFVRSVVKSKLHTYRHGGRVYT